MRKKGGRNYGWDYSKYKTQQEEEQQQGLTKYT